MQLCPCWKDNATIPTSKNLVPKYIWQHAYPDPHNPVQRYGLLDPYSYMDANSASWAMIVSQMIFELVTPHKCNWNIIRHGEHLPGLNHTIQNIFNMVEEESWCTQVREHIPPRWWKLFINNDLDAKSYPHVYIAHPTKMMKATKCCRYIYGSSITSSQKDTQSYPDHYMNAYMPHSACKLC